jgi:MFS transporter, DHA2 family, multidrug resistance protein
MWSFSFITSDWGGDQLLWPQLLRGFPQVFCVAPSVTLGLGSLPPHRLKYASGLFNMMRNLGGAVGIAVCSAILNNRTNLHFLALASNLTAAHAPTTRLLQDMTHHLTQVLGSPAAAHRAALRELWELTYAQAATLSYADAFRTIMLAFMLGTCLVPLMKKIVPPNAPARDSH